MPKYYISDENTEIVVSSDKDPLSLLVDLMKTYRLPSVMVGGYYRISEQGFTHRSTDLMIPSDLVNKKAMGT